jgi:hypothetical protein
MSFCYLAHSIVKSFMIKRSRRQPEEQACLRRAAFQGISVSVGEP